MEEAKGKIKGKTGDFHGLYFCNDWWLSEKNTQTWTKISLFFLIPLFKDSLIL